MKNVDASHCGENIADVQILYDDLNHWKSYAQYYHETSESNDNYNGERYAFEFGPENIMFTDMLPISVKIIMSTGREIELWGIIDNIATTGSFISGQLICDGVKCIYIFDIVVYIMYIYYILCIHIDINTYGSNTSTNY